MNYLFEFLFNQLSFIGRSRRKSETSKERVINREILILDRRKTRNLDKKKLSQCLKIRLGITFFQGRLFQTSLNAFIANVTNLSLRQ